MKILHVTKKYPNAMGGDAFVVYNLEKQQKKNGHKVFILTSNCDEIQNNSNLIKFGLKDKSRNLDRITVNRIISLIFLFLQSFKILKQIKPDIVHSHSIDMGFILSFACKKYNIPIINTCHGVSFNDSQFSIFKRIIELFFLKTGRFNKIITVDQNSLEYFKENNINNVIYISNGIDLDEFKKNKRSNNDKKLRIIFVGRLEEQKGLKYLIESVKTLQNKEFELIIIGSGTQENKLRSLVKEYGLGEKIIFLGNKKNKETIRQLFNSDIFILPSIWEGFPITILEAWGASLPVIVTSVGGVSKICKNNKNALIISSRSPKEITNCLVTLINDSGLRKTLGENGRKLVEGKYNWKTIAEQMVNIYKRVIYEKN